MEPGLRLRCESVLPMSAGQSKGPLQDPAEEAGNEMDSEKLTAVITELDRVVWEGEENARQQRRS